MCIKSEFGSCCRFHIFIMKLKIVRCLGAALGLCILPPMLHAQNAGDVVTYIKTVHIAPESFHGLMDFSDRALKDKSSLSGDFAFRDADYDGEIGRLFDSNLEQFAYTLGYSHEFDGFHLGFALNAAEVELNSDPSEGNNNAFESTQEGSGFHLAVSGAKVWGKWRLTLLGGFGDMAYDGQRQFVSGPALPKTASFDLSSYTLQARVDYSLMDSGASWAVVPFATLGTIQAEADGFSEVDVSGNAGDETTVSPFEDSLPFLEGGVTVKYLNFARVAPGLRLRVRQDLGDDTVEYSYTISTFPPINREIPDPDQTRFLADVFVDFSFTEKFRAEARLGLDSGDASSGFSGGLALSYRFD